MRITALTKWQNLIIKRKRWLHGPLKESEDKFSYLRHPETNKQCCLGFYARSCGIPIDHIIGVTTPDLINDFDQATKISRLFNDEGSINSRTNGLMVANDESGVTLADREAKIRKLFRKLKVRVRFID